ncbi:hypothetical protein M758_6G038300 [Ceratodon purpureus]|nr:hypothetical protein M758_6G038300 [Ceratodon purpureus]
MERADGASSSGVTNLDSVVNEEEKVGIGTAAVPGKLKVVRIKRKREQAPIESLWLEVSGPPSKRHEPDISSLSLEPESTSLPPTNIDTTTPSKVLFRRLETVSPSSKTEASLVESLLQKVNERKHAYEKRKEQQDSRAKSKAQGKQVLAAAKERHEVIAKRARFEQVWKSRRDVAKAAAENAESDPMRELFHLYDVVRVDEESPEALAKREKAKREAEEAQDAILRNYLPLLRECLPEAAADLEQDLNSRGVSVETDDYVYDVYAMDEGFSDDEDDEEAFYPTVQIVETEGFDLQEADDSDYDSEDSNDENNPLNDYPDEDDFGGFGDEKDSDDSDDSGDFDPYGSDDEEYDTVAYDNEEELRWSRRQ